MGALRLEMEKRRALALTHSAVLLSLVPFASNFVSFSLLLHICIFHLYLNPLFFCIFYKRAFEILILVRNQLCFYKFDCLIC